MKVLWFPALPRKTHAPFPKEWYVNQTIDQKRQTNSEIFIHGHKRNTLTNEQQPVYMHMKLVIIGIKNHRRNKKKAKNKHKTTTDDEDDGDSGNENNNNNAIADDYSEKLASGKK